VVIKNKHHQDQLPYIVDYLNSNRYLRGIKSLNQYFKKPDKRCVYRVGEDTVPWEGVVLPTKEKGVIILLPKVLPQVLLVWATP
jgi:hypothetical protein